MPNSIIQFKCILISPSDVSAEREAIADVVQRWNAQIGAELDVHLDIVKWETHATPDLHGSPQEVINRQLVDSCDFGIAVFWHRLGTPTTVYSSGSVEEVELLLEKGKRVLLYFNKRDIPQNALIESDQFLRLQKVKEDYRNRGISFEYEELASLREMVLLHLTNVVTNMVSSGRAIPLPEAETAPKPDVRVTVRPGFLQALFSQKNLIVITVENHSSIPVFINQVGIELKNNLIVVFPSDFITKAPIVKTRLEPGDSYSINIDPNSLVPLMVNGFGRAFAADAVGRKFVDDKTEIHSLVMNLNSLS